MKTTEIPKSLSQKPFFSPFIFLYYYYYFFKMTNKQRVMMIDEWHKEKDPIGFHKNNFSICPIHISISDSHMYPKYIYRITNTSIFHSSSFPCATNIPLLGLFFFLFFFSCSLIIPYESFQLLTHLSFSQSLPLCHHLLLSKLGHLGWIHLTFSLKKKKKKRKVQPM